MLSTPWYLQILFSFIGSFFVAFLFEGLIRNFLDIKIYWRRKKNKFYKLLDNVQFELSNLLSLRINNEIEGNYYLDKEKIKTFIKSRDIFAKLLNKIITDEIIPGTIRPIIVDYKNKISQVSFYINDIENRIMKTPSADPERMEDFLSLQKLCIEMGELEQKINGLR